MNAIKDSSLSGTIQGKVKELRGYSKPKVQLSTHNDWERSFIENAGEGDVSSLATQIFEEMRDLFRYKRKELTFSAVGANATIECPDFDVNIVLAQDTEDAERYTMKIEVRSFRNADIVDDPRFLSIFTKYCKRVEFELDKQLNLEDLIDDIEEVDALRACLEYDPECTELTLRMPAPGIILHVTERHMTFMLDSHGDLKKLLSFTRTTIDQLTGSHIALGLSTS